MKLVLLHALPFDGRMWDTTSSSIIDDVITPDLFRLGDSIEQWAAGVLDHVGSDELIVVGASVGGSCALEVAFASPDQVAAIVLLGAKAEVNPEPKLRDHALRVLETNGMEAAWEEFWLPLFARTTSDEIKQRARSLALEQDVAEIAAGVTAFHDRRDLSAFAASWTGPLIGISGEHDFAPTPAKVQALTNGPHRRFDLVPDCGHYVSLEQPETFAALLDRAIQFAAA